jgi:hypothetical protein
VPLTISNWTGDGPEPIIATAIELPDSGTSVIITGTVTAQGGGPAVPVTGSPLAAPAPPGSGSVFWIIQVNTTTGAATVKQSTVSMPAPDPGNVMVFQQTLVPASTDEALVATDVTPDTY